MVRDIPLSVYRTWPAPNYKDPVTRGSGLVVINAIFISLVTFSIAIRVYSRMKQTRPGIDDIMIYIAYVFTIGLTVVVLLANQSYGWDRHTWDVPAHAIQPAAILAFAAKLAFVCASCFTRLSLIFLYYRLIQESTVKWYRWSIHFGLFFNLAVFVSLIFVGVFGCIPVRKYWTFPEVVDGTCLDEGVITMAAGVMSCMADLLCTLLPVPIIMRLHMPLRDRIGVIVLLSAGIIVTIAGVLRTVFIWQALVTTYDESWHTYPLWICAAVEIDLAVICACVPAMKTVLWKPFQRWTGEIYSQFSSHRDTKPDKNSKNKPELTSQDPIVEGRDDDSDESHHGYRMASLEFGKDVQIEHDEVDYHGSLEKSITRLPSKSQTRGGRDNKKASLTVNDLSSPASKLEIQKETTFQVSTINDQDLIPEQRETKEKKLSLTGKQIIPDRGASPVSSLFPKVNPYRGDPNSGWN